MCDSRVAMLKYCWKDSANIKVIFTSRYSSGCDRKSGMPQYLVYVLNTEDKTNCGGHIVCFHCVNHRSLFECFIFFQESLLLLHLVSFIVFRDPNAMEDLGCNDDSFSMNPNIPNPNQYPNPIPFRFFDFFKNRKWPPVFRVPYTQCGAKISFGGKYPLKNYTAQSSLVSLSA